jgi:hypothetical protein
MVRFPSQPKAKRSRTRRPGTTSLAALAAGLSAARPSSASFPVQAAKPIKHDFQVLWQSTLKRLSNYTGKYFSADQLRAYKITLAPFDLNFGIISNGGKSYHVPHSKDQIKQQLRRAFGTYQDPAGPDIPVAEPFRVEHIDALNFGGMINRYLTEGAARDALMGGYTQWRMYTYANAHQCADRTMLTSSKGTTTVMSATTDGRTGRLTVLSGGRVAILGCLTPMCPTRRVPWPKNFR